MESKPRVPSKLSTKSKELTNEMAAGDVPVGFFHENEGVSAVGLITPKQYKSEFICSYHLVATKREFIEEYQQDFDGNYD